MTEEFDVSHEKYSEVPLDNIAESLLKKYATLFNKDSLLNYDFQLSFADEYLGSKFKKARISLYLILFISELCDKISFDFKNKGPKVSELLKS